jgi:hypothetical protein
VKWANIPDYGFGYRTAAGISVVGVVTEPGQRAGMQQKPGSDLFIAIVPQFCMNLFSLTP